MKTSIAQAILILLAGVSLGQAQSLYESDDSGQINVFSANGTQTTFVSGNALATNGSEATFARGSSEPYGSTFNSSGNQFVMNSDNEQTTFASGLTNPYGLAFDSSGNLFVANSGSGEIAEFSTNGTQTTFATGLGYPVGLTFDQSGNLFVTATDGSSGNIYEFSTNGTKSLFASGLSPEFLTFGPNPVPEPSSYALLVLGAIALIVAARRKTA